MRKRFGFRGRIAVAVLVVAVGAAAATSSTVFGKAHIAAAAAKCGMGTGKAATGSPIVLGAIAVDQPGTSFTDIPNMTDAYFKCVNANGGIYGHPIKLDIVTDQTQPNQLAADAKQLLNTDHVVGIAGSSDIIDCAVNAATYAKAGVKLIGAGIAQQCYSSPWSAAVNMGPRFSSDGAVQTAIAHGAKKIVFDQSNVPGYQWNAAGLVKIAKAHHIPIVTLTENAASLNGETVAEKEIQDAGPDGAVVLNFTPPVAQAILQGAQKLNLEDKVIWACSTPCNSDSLAKSLGPQWNHKLFVNAEMNDVHSDNGADSKLYLSVLSKYGSAVSGGIGSFSQFGFTIGQLATQALLSIKSHTYTFKTVNAAFEALKGFKTDMLCRPWYYGTGSTHLPNNSDFTVWPENGTFQIVPKSGCLSISSDDPLIAQVRAYEKSHGI